MKTHKQHADGLRHQLAKWLAMVPGDSSFVGPPRKVLTSTPLRCTSDGYDKCILLHSQRTVTRTPATYADSPIATIFNEMQTGIVKEQFVASLEKGRYWGRCAGYIINSDDCLHRDLSPSFEDVTSDNSEFKLHDAIKQPILPRIRDIPGTVAALNTLFASNFHHWLLDCVPKFGLLRSAGFDFSSFNHFILTAPVSPWHIEVLGYLGIPMAKIIASSPRLHIRADRLIVPSFSEPSRQPHKYNYTPQGIDFVRQLLLAGFKSLSSYPEKIIVSREQATCRRLLRSDTIYPALEREGFVIVILEGLTLREQAKIFFAAKKIIMPTGGGLANLAFCQPNAEVVELFSPAYMPTFSLALSSYLGFQYSALVGDNISAATGHSDGGASEDISIPLEQLMAHI